VLVERGGRDGSAVASVDGVTVALDTTLDDELRREGRVYDLIRGVQNLRKAEGLELTDRIVLTVPQSDADLVERHGDWIKDEVLALEIRTGGDLAVEKASAA
jgi:isoleucyl-tRNA synthetase